MDSNPPSPPLDRSPEEIRAEAGATLSRRDLLRSALGLAGAAVLAPLASACAARQLPGSAAARVDDSFARLTLELLAGGPPGLADRLRDHPALEAVLRHQRMTGNPGATRDGVLAGMLESARRARPTAAVLEAWAGHERELVAAAARAGEYLPAGWRFSGTIHLMMGYDIGIPAPPDIALNVAHPHFVERPRELGFYATHEAHHVGFYARRPLPPIEGLGDSSRLLGLIAYLTQLEGMAVHAARPARAAAGALGDDGDYGVYLDASERSRVVSRYAELLGRAETARSESDVGEVLEIMSTRERLWYRFGATVAWTLEQRQGRAALVDTIARPASFFATAAAVLRDAGATAPGGW